MSIITSISGAQEVRGGLAQRANRVMGGVGKAVKTEAINLVAYIVNEKLSDQVLKVRSGRLRRSITAQFDDSDSTFSARVGTNVVYARALEYGFNGTVEVPQYDRMQTMAWGRQMANPRMVTVRAHPMKMNIAEHPFMRPSLAENKGRIIDNLRQAILEAIQ